MSEPPRARRGFVVDDAGRASYRRAIVAEGAAALPPPTSGSRRFAPWLGAAGAAGLALALGACAEGASPSPEDECLAHCASDDPCEDAFCDAAGECRRIPAEVAAACRTDLHCDDGDACTVDTCVPVAGCGFMRCRHGDVDCGANTPCQRVSCDPVQGCLLEPIGTDVPCAGVADCDDGDNCTTDTCEWIPECGLSVCHIVPAPGCVPCAVDADCVSCRTGRCVEGRCRFGGRPADCDERCRPDVASPHVASDASAFRGIARPEGAACPSDCDCARTLVLALEDGALTLYDDLELSFGTCAVDVCEVETVSCEPLVAGRGYVVSGHKAIGRDDGFVVDYFCLATNSELMVGDWTGELVKGDGSVARFTAHVAPSDDPSARVTTFVVDALEHGWLQLPAQTFTLADGGLRLDVALTTSRGVFTGYLTAGPFAIEGALQSDAADAPSAMLRLTPAP